MKKCFYIGLGVLLFSCSKPKETSSPIPREKFVSLLIRMHIIDARIGFAATVDPFAANAHYNEYDSLLKHYQVDSAMLSANFDHYRDRQEELSAIYKEVQDSLVSMAQKTVKIK